MVIQSSMSHNINSTMSYTSSSSLLNRFRTMVFGVDVPRVAETFESAASEFQQTCASVNGLIKPLGLVLDKNMLRIISAIRYWKLSEKWIDKVLAFCLLLDGLDLGSLWDVYGRFVS